MFLLIFRRLSDGSTWVPGAATWSLRVPFFYILILFGGILLVCLPRIRFHAAVREFQGSLDLQIQLGQWCSCHDLQLGSIFGSPLCSSRILRLSKWATTWGFPRSPPGLSVFFGGEVPTSWAKWYHSMLLFTVVVLWCFHVIISDHIICNLSLANAWQRRYGRSADQTSTQFDSRLVRLTFPYALSGSKRARQKVWWKA